MSAKTSTQSGIDDCPSPAKSVERILGSTRIRRLLGVIQSLNGFARLVLERSEIRLTAHISGNAWC
jgi:hypothetical protein